MKSPLIDLQIQHYTSKKKTGFFPNWQAHSKMCNEMQKIYNCKNNFKKEKPRCTKEAKDYKNWPGRLENGQNELLE